ncbi:MAG: aminodeoxychorismate synthase component I [Pseudohongiellaceae bacterium]
MRSLSDLPNPAFLNSGGNAPGSRWEILSALPSATLTVRNGHISCSDLSPEELRLNFFDILALLTERYTPSAATKDAVLASLPFSGGAIGFVGYPELTNTSNQLVTQAFFGIYLWAIVTDHQAQHSTLFFLPGLSQQARDKVMAAINNQQPKPNEFKLVNKFSNDVAETDYRSGFGSIKAFIRDGDCYQVNLTQRFSSRFTGKPIDAYLQLLKQIDSPMCAFLAWDQEALLSLSPERFLKLDRGLVTTQPIKGTRPRGSTESDDLCLARELQHSEKDKAENLMIVDLLRNDLGAVCEYGSIQVDALFQLQSFNNVHHLVSTVSGKLRTSESGFSLFAKCFPGGSVTGAPKIRAMEIISELESFDRGPYCGSVAYFSFNGRLDSSITIRSLYCRNDEIYCWAGGGIVEDSDFSQEFQECMDKINNLIRILQNIN